MLLQVELTHIHGLMDPQLLQLETFTSAATYTVTGTDASNGCTNTADITITVDNTQPTVVITNNETASSTEVTCANTEISVTASGADSYAWSDGSSTSTTRDFTSAATYTVTGTDASNGCTNTAEITITENTTTPGAYAGDDFTKGCTDNASGSSIGVTDEAEIILHGLVVMTKVVVLTHGQFLQLVVQDIS